MADADVTSLQGYDAEFTATTGLLLYAVYNFLMVIVLLNMLVAMMSLSYECIAVSMVIIAC